jgi:hypothetical protein
LKHVYETGNLNENKDKIKAIAKIIIKLFERKRNLLQEIILLKSAFSIIDQMFHKEIKDAELKRSSFCYSGGNNDNDNPENMNDFIKNLMDPFANYNKSFVSIKDSKDLNDSRDLYYEDYYKLYDIN